MGAEGSSPPAYDSHHTPAELTTEQSTSVDAYGATFDPAAPRTCGDDSPDIWLTFTSTERRTAQLFTGYSYYLDTVEIFEATPAGWHSVHCDDYGEPSVEFQAEVNRTYLIRLAGTSPYETYVSLVLPEPPANDTRNEATSVEPTPVPMVDANASVSITGIHPALDFGAGEPIGTRDPEDPSCGPVSSSTTWTRFVATSEATTITTRSDRDATIGVYRAAGDELIPVACLDSAATSYNGDDERARLVTTPGATYLVMTVLARDVHRDGGVIVDVAQATRGSEESFTDAHDLGPIGAQPLTATLPTFLSTREEGEPASSCQNGGTTWLTFTAPVRGTVRATVSQPDAGGSFRSAMDTEPSAAAAVFRGNELSFLEEVACATSSPSYSGYTIVPVLAGERYAVAVGGATGFDDDVVTVELLWVGESPPNDDRADASALDLTSGPQKVAGTSAGAHATADEPTDCDPYSYLGPRSGLVWYSFVPSSSGVVEFTPTELEEEDDDKLYHGRFDGTEVTVDENGDVEAGEPAPPGPRHEYALVPDDESLRTECGALDYAHAHDVVGGVRYFLGVFAEDSVTTGPFEFMARFTPAPPNDRVADAVPVNADLTPVTLAGTTFGATALGDPFSGCGWWNEVVVWYRVKVTREANLRIARPSGLGLSAFPITADGSLGTPQCGYPYSDLPTVFVAKAGQEFLVGAGTWRGSGQPFQLTFDVVPRPANDSPATATLLGPNPIAHTLGNYDGATGGDVPGCMYSGGTRTVWYRVVADRRRLMRTTVSSESYTDLAVFRGSAATQNLVGCGSAALDSVATTQIEAGQTYLIAVGVDYATEAAGSFDLAVELLDPPANDELAGAITLPVAGTVSGSTANATSEDPLSGAPTCETYYRPSTVWYRIDPKTPGALALSLSGPGHRLRVLRDTGGSRTLVGCYPVTTPATVAVDAGSTYFVGVEPNAGVRGAFELTSALVAVGAGPAVSVADAGRVAEDAPAATFTVRLDRASLAPVHIDYVTGDGGAIADADYSATSGHLTFEPGQTSRTIEVPIANDALDEDDEESLFLVLSRIVGGRPVDTSATAIIADDDASPSLSVTGPVVTESDSTGVATVTVALSAPSGRSVSVAYRTSAGSAVPGRDYEERSGTLVFEPGASEATFTVPITGDRRHERDEVFFVGISDAVNATISVATAGVAIHDDDGRPVRAG